MRHTARHAAALLTLAVPLLTAACDSGTEPRPQAAAIALTAAVDLLPAGQTTPLDVVVEDASGNVIQDPEITWSSTHPSLVSIDENGLLTAQPGGEAVVTVTATADAVSASVEIWIFDHDLCAEAVAISPGQSIRASLQAGDCTQFIDDGSFADAWFFELQQQTTVTVDMASTELDPYLFVFPDTGTVDYQDDNSGDGTNARVVQSLPAGLYFILANTFPGESGNYTLTVSGTPAADPASGGAAALRAERIRTLPAAAQRSRE